MRYIARQVQQPRFRSEVLALAALKNAQKNRVFSPLLAPVATTEIARDVLVGRAAMLAGQPQLAETAFRRAMKIQKEASFSSDLPTWWYPVRRSVAAALIAQRDRQSTRHQLLTSLKGWSNDPDALRLLARAERALGRNVNANQHLRQARAQWAGDMGKLALPLA